MSTADDPRLPDNLRRRARNARRFLVGLAREYGAVQSPDPAVDPSRLARQVISVDEGLTELEPDDPELADLAAIAFFLGLSRHEVSRRMGRDDDDLASDWSYVAAWLRRRCARVS